MLGTEFSGQQMAELPPINETLVGPFLDSQIQPWNWRCTQRKRNVQRLGTEPSVSHESVIAKRRINKCLPDINKSAESSKFSSGPPVHMPAHKLKMRRLQADLTTIKCELPVVRAPAQRNCWLPNSPVYVNKYISQEVELGKKNRSMAMKKLTLLVSSRKKSAGSIFKHITNDRIHFQKLRLLSDF